MEYLWRPAHGPLASAVEGCWYQRGPAPSRVERILPMPRVHLVVNLSGQPYLVRTADTPWRELGRVFCSGLRDHVVLSAGPDLIINAGAVLRPDALPALGLDPIRLAGKVADVAIELPFAPEDTGEVVLDRLEAALRSRLLASSLDPVVRGVVRALDAQPGTPIGQLAAAAGMSHPALVPRFRRSTGITPKLFAELVRFHRMIDLISVPDDVSWSRLAAESGYYDQSHATRSFRQFAGLTPAAYYRKVREGGPDSVRFVPEAAADLPGLRARDAGRE